MGLSPAGIMVLASGNINALSGMINITTFKAGQFTDADVGGIMLRRRLVEVTGESPSGKNSAMDYQTSKVKMFFYCTGIFGTTRVNEN